MRVIKRNDRLWPDFPEHQAWALPEGRDNYNAQHSEAECVLCSRVSGLNPVPTHINNAILGKLCLCPLFFLSVKWG